MKHNTLTLKISLVLLSLLMLFLSSCEQYEYSSPEPGVLEIRFRTKSNSIPFSELNNFVMLVTSVQATRNDDAYLQVFQDLRAIRRENSYYNILAPAARDSELVIGQAYAPPGSYKGIKLQMGPSGGVVLDGYRIIPVVKVNEGEDELVFVRDFQIEQYKTTYITLTVDLDSTLSKGVDKYYYKPYFYVSSSGQH